jgi:hypothetical protein
MDSEGIKERFMTNMWLLFSERLATEALYNICTQPTMSNFREAFLGILLPDTKEGLGDFSVRLNADHGGIMVSLEIQTGKQVIFIEPRFFAPAQDCVSSRTALLRKEYAFLEERTLCILTIMDRGGEIEETNRSEVAPNNAVEVRCLLWPQILGVFARARRVRQRPTKEKGTAFLSLRGLKNDHII